MTRRRGALLACATTCAAVQCGLDQRCPAAINTTAKLHAAFERAASAGARRARNAHCGADEFSLDVQHNGLRSDEVAVFLLSTIFHYCGRAASQINTWGRAFPHLYTVLPETGKPWGDRVAEKTAIQQDWARFRARCPVMDRELSLIHI